MVLCSLFTRVTRWWALLPPPGYLSHSFVRLATHTRSSPRQFLYFYPDSEAKLIEMINSQAVVA